MLNENLKCITSIRHNEYYNMQNVIDSLYEQSKQNVIFTDLMDIILSEENILMAYRNIKNNTGSSTCGTDGLTISDIAKLSHEDVVNTVRFILVGSQHGYRPKPVKRCEIPKPDGTQRPLGIPCIWDRLIQQCIKQILEPICEAKFSRNSYGFRPDRCVAHAMHRYYQTMQIMHLHYVIEFDIKGFFDNVNHSKLIKQIWALGIHDKQLIYIIKKMLTAQIKMPDGTMITPTCGTPQGGILSPLLANIVLNELDKWVESQWEENPVCYKWKTRISNSGGLIKPGYRLMRSTKMKEMYIIRYADDFRIMCRTREDAENTKIAITKWLQERLKLSINEEKTKIVNVKKQYSHFLGFKVKVHSKSNKLVVTSHVADEVLDRITRDLKEQAKNIAHPRKGKNEIQEIISYNAKVMGMQNYYKLATEISEDFGLVNRKVMHTLESQLNHGKRDALKRKGRQLTPHEKKRYKNSKMLRYVSDQPIYPIGYVVHQKPLAQKRDVCRYTPEGRTLIHDNLSSQLILLTDIMNSVSHENSVELADNKISLYSAQHGKCAITGNVFESVHEIHCHHKIPQSKGGTDEYNNLILVHVDVHKLLHAVSEDTIRKYLQIINPSPSQLIKINELREKAGLNKILK